MNEHELQSQIIAWARLMQFQWPCLRWLHAIPNGAKLPWRKNANGIRYSPEAIKLKAEGLTPGVCDLFLPFAARGFHGLYIELKRPGEIGAVRPGQAEFMAYCESAGYLANVFDNFDDTIESIEWYLSATPAANTGSPTIPLDKSKYATDGFGNTWPPCAKCGSKLQVVRPGEARCPKCDA